jgi:hypothetical protein
MSRFGNASSARLCTAVQRTIYSTQFSLTENPVFEGSAWIGGDAPYEAAVATSGGFAIGTQTGNEYAGSGIFNDSHAFLAMQSSFPPNQRAWGVIHKTGTPATGTLEVELLLRMTYGPLRTGLTYGNTREYGYEINVSAGGEWGQYLQIGKWKELNLYDSQAHGGTEPIDTLGGTQDGDIFIAEIVGTTITIKLTRSSTTYVLATAVDNSGTPFMSGSPGLGFYKNNNGGATIDAASHCLTSFTAESI